MLFCIYEQNASNDQGSPKPGHVERISGIVASADDISLTGAFEKEAVDVSAAVKGNIEDVSKESLRINSKYVTDGEVCSIFVCKLIIIINFN